MQANCANAGEQKSLRGTEAGARPEKLFFSGSFGVFATEALNPAGGIHQLLLASKKGMAVGADFNVDVALMGGASGKSIAAGAVHPNLVVRRMYGCLHESNSLLFYRRLVEGSKRGS